MMIDLQDQNPNNISDSLVCNFPPAATPVQIKRQEPGGRSASKIHDNTLLPIPAILNRASRFGPQREIMVSDASELAESMILRRKLLNKEHSESYDRVSPNSAGLNFDNDVIDINSTSWGNEIDEDEFRHWQDVQHEQQMYTTAGDPGAFARNDNNLHELGEDVLLKTMGWFPVEEYSNEDNENTRSLRWILDEPPCASDLPHLENLMEMSPSKFWSPRSESKNRPPVQFGYFSLSKTPQSSHSIHYFLKDSPTLPTDMTRTVLGCASGRRNSNLGCSPLCRNIHAQNVLTPICFSKGLVETSLKSPSLGPESKVAAQIRCVSEICPALSEGNATKNASPEHNVATTACRDHTHPQGIGTVAKTTASNPAARRLQLSQRGTNLVLDLFEVGKVDGEARQTRNDTPPRDTNEQSRTALLTKSEKTSDQLRLQCLTELSSKDRESALPSSELQIIRGAAGNELTERASPIHQNGTRERAVHSVPISNLPNLATSVRYSLHEKLESQPSYLEPLSEPLKTERLVTFRCSEPTQDKFAWSNPAVPRVSRKRSNRITTPKLMRVDIFKLHGNGKIPQPIRTTPVKNFYTCQRRKRTRKRRLEELPTAQRNVKLKFTSPRDCEIDIREMGVQEDTSSNKPPTLTRIIKPLLHVKTTPPRGYTKWALRSTVTREPLADSQNTNAMQHAPSNIPNDVTEAVVSPEQYPESSRSTLQNQRVEEEISQTAPEDSVSNIDIDPDVPNNRSSKYRGVTRLKSSQCAFLRRSLLVSHGSHSTIVGISITRCRHRHTGRYEAHLWDNTKLKQGLAKRGRQVYLGAYTNEDQAAQAHDLAALKYWGSKTYINFPLNLYKKELETMRNFTREEYIVLLRRRSPGFTRGVSKYRGVTRHHQEGRWEARIGRHSGAKYHYLGTYDTQEEAAAAYDRAAVRNRGIKAITNFDISNYIKTSFKAHNTDTTASESPTSSESLQMSSEISHFDV